jgi:clan AA aspartic protease
MGTFRCTVEIAATGDGPFERVEALVDTGATYSQFPRSLLARLGVSPHDRAEFVLADGRTVLRDLATVVVRLEGRVRHVLCVVGDDGTEPLLGATTLELFGLAADPVNRRLVRATLYLL